MKLTTVSLAAATLSTTSHALFGGKPPPPIEPNLVDGFPWTDLFASKALDAFDSQCEAEKIFPAREYTLHNLMEEAPMGLLPYGDALKVFFSGREYPGGWAGYDRHRHDRQILSMNYNDIPLAVRVWIEEEDRSGGDGKGLFGVFKKPKGDGETVASTVEFPKANKVDRSHDKEKIAIFAPGAIYHVLPLWVAEGSDCQGE